VDQAMAQAALAERTFCPADSVLVRHDCR
jgi:hypothetical protein